MNKTPEWLKSAAKFYMQGSDQYNFSKKYYIIFSLNLIGTPNKWANTVGPQSKIFRV